MQTQRLVFANCYVEANDIARRQTAHQRRLHQIENRKNPSWCHRSKDDPVFTAQHRLSKAEKTKQVVKQVQLEKDKQDLQQRIKRIDNDLDRAKLGQRKLAYGRRKDAGAVSNFARVEAARALAQENAKLQARIRQVAPSISRPK